jgi:hypothetical protein
MEIFAVSLEILIEKQSLLQDVATTLIGAGFGMLEGQAGRDCVCLTAAHKLSTPWCSVCSSWLTGGLERRRNSGLEDSFPVSTQTRFRYILFLLETLGLYVREHEGTPTRMWFRGRVNREFICGDVTFAASGDV